MRLKAGYLPLRKSVLENADVKAYYVAHPDQMAASDQLAGGAAEPPVGAWNSFLWVIIVTNSPEMHTVPVGLNSLVLETDTHFNLLMATAVMAALPLLALFLVAERQFVQGIARVGLKE